MTTRRFSLSQTLATASDVDRDEHTIWTIEHAVHELLDRAHESSERLLWSTFSVGTELLLDHLAPVVRVSIVGVVEDDLDEPEAL